MSKKATLFSVLLLSLIMGEIQSNAQPHRRDWGAFKVSDDSALSIAELFFADTSTGYLSVGCLTQRYGYSYRWYRTINGGVTWEKITFSGMSPGDTAQILCYQYSTPSPNSVFLATTRLFYSYDRGLHWDTTSQSINFSKPFAMFTEKDGIALGYIPRKGEAVIKTSTGVHGFAPIGYDSLLGWAIGNDDWLGPIFFPAGAFSSPDLGCIVVADGSTQKGCGLTSLVTSDGGVSWSKYNTLFPGHEKDTLYGDVQFQKGTPNLWEFPQRSRWLQQRRNLAGLQFCNITYCFSTDCGKSWSYDTSFSTRWTSVFGIEPGNVWMTVHDSTNQSNIWPAFTIAHTTDYGSDWDLDTVSPYIPDIGHADCRTVYFQDKSHGWIGALVRGKPYVLKYYPPSASGVSTEHRRLSSTRPNLIYPNPCKNLVSISSLLESPIQSVEIFDCYARHVDVPAIVEANSIKLDTQGLEDGVWCAVITHSTGYSTARFVVQH